MFHEETGAGKSGYLILIAIRLMLGCNNGEESEEIRAYETPWGDWDSGSNLSSEDCRATVEYLFAECDYQADYNEDEMIILCSDVAKVDWKNCPGTAVKSEEACSDQAKGALACEGFI